MPQHAKEQQKTFSPETSPQLDTQPIAETSAEHLANREMSGQETQEVSTPDHTVDVVRDTLKKTRQPRPTNLPQIRDALTIQVEKVMEEGLADAYKAMTPVQQQEFKIKGEETALQIRYLMKKSKIKVKKVFQLLLEWLKILPGINKFFLEQEAKIKADKIIAIHKLRHHR